MRKPLTNFAFIDGTNLHRSAVKIGWKISWRKFRRYLEETYAVTRAYYFIGRVENNQSLYDTLKSAGFELVFKETYIGTDGELKGNIDADLVLKAMTHYRIYEKAVIVTSDGDFGCLIKYLIQKNKLRSVITSRRCSHLVEKAAGSYMCYIDELRNKLEYL